tara:strand:- start:352 stop:1014 length:663 start_codon:yes stop_codon:yes gene_type:complete
MAQEKPAGTLLDEFHYFVTPIYITKQPQFLDTVKTIAADSIKQAHGKAKPNKIYPVLMSGNMLEDPRVKEFANFVGSTAWNILSSQGYAMDQFNTTFTEMWCQEHYQTSSMDYHTHPGDNLLVGFYFLDTPEGTPSAVIHDPRAGRLMLDLPQRDVNQATLASTMVNFAPEPGMMMFAPAWLAHSFGRNPSKEPFRFVHFNLGVKPSVSAACSMPEAEVI